MAPDLCNNSTTLIPRFQNKAALCYTSQIFLNNVIFWIYYLHSFILYLFVRGSRLIGQSPIKSLSSFCLSVHLSVRPSLNFLKIGSSAFSDIVHDDSWRWYPVTDRAKFSKKKNWRLEFGLMGQNRAQNYAFFIFSSLVY